jgi:hypothetical protein
MTDEDDMREVSRELPALDVDPDAAARIASAARRGRPLRRTIEVVLVVLVAAGFLAWAVMKVLEALR